MLTKFEKVLIGLSIVNFDVVVLDRVAVGDARNYHEIFLCLKI